MFNVWVNVYYSYDYGNSTRLLVACIKSHGHRLSLCTLHKEPHDRQPRIVSHSVTHTHAHGNINIHCRNPYTRKP